MKINSIVKWIANIIFISVIGIVLISIFYKKPSGEAYIGDFSNTPFNRDWTLETDGETKKIDIPYVVDDAFKKKLIIHNTLPEDLSKGMRICLRANMEDVYVFIDGVLRQQYDSEQVSIAGYYTPSAYVFIDLNSDDSGKDITIEYLVKKNKGSIEKISIAYGNNAWFEVLKDNIFETVVAIIMVLLGVLAIITYFIFRKKFLVNNSVLYLGQSVVMIGIWILSESKLRQILLAYPSLSGIFCYISLELMEVFVFYYFDEVQGKKYHKIYGVLGVLALLQLLLNVVLATTGISDFHETLILSHMWIIIGIIFAICFLIRDYKLGYTKKYNITAIGIMVFLASSVIEMVAFYLVIVNALGIYLCIGLVILLGATVLQMLVDVFRNEKKSKEHIQKTIMATIETIAGSIDAKDEYTGGHSERVAYYASCLAKRVRDEYGFDEEDIMRIHYIALMHDIGKIGVPDIILNKNGKLTEDEFQLMKRHAVIGGDLLKEIDTIEGLDEGVRHHHERYDGKGYPDGLKGEEIPLIARILCLADCYDAMTSNRVYRPRLTDEAVRNEIEKCSGSQFDPKLAKVFCELLDCGEIKPVTQHGFEVNEDGTVLKSSVLRDLLVSDIIRENFEILNPSFVRMISYLVKISEKQDKNVRIYLVECKTDTGEEAKSVTKKLVKKYSNKNDISIDYSENKVLVVWFDIDEAEAGHRISALKKDSAGVIEMIFKQIENM